MHFQRDKQPVDHDPDGKKQYRQQQDPEKTHLRHPFDLGMAEVHARNHVTPTFDVTQHNCK